MSAEIEEISAGGVVSKDGNVIVIRPKGRATINLPKGHLESGETAEQAAIREIREETGLTVKAVAKLSEVKYSYKRNGKKIPKLVTFFLCEYLEGSVEDHDDEVEYARWLPIDVALRKLTFPSEKAVLKAAVKRLK